MKLSIVLTVYNKEHFLKRAFDAVLNQKDALPECYEVLVVNDGSTDGSASVIEQYAQKDNRVIVITQPNQGLSMARNNGIKAASGDYIWFVDADDTISSNAVHLIYKAMSSEPDLIPIYALTQGDDRVRNENSVNCKSGKEILINNKWEHCGVFWVFRKSFLLDNDLFFYPGIYHEDTEFTPRMLYAARSVQVIPEILYTVYREPNSITQVPRSKRAFDCLIVASRLSSFIEAHKEMEDNIKSVFYNIISLVINNALYVISQNDRFEQKKFDEALLKEGYLINYLSLAHKKKYRIEGRLFQLFPRHYVRLYNFLKLL